MQTFTAGFARPGYSEIEEAQETAAALGLPNIPYVITAQEFTARLPQIVWHLDDPMADAAAVGLWFVAREARRHVKVMLCGEGADELFGGYRVYSQPGGRPGGDQAAWLRPVDRAGDGRQDSAWTAWQGVSRAHRDAAAKPVYRQRQHLLRRGNRRADQVHGGGTVYDVTKARSSVIRPRPPKLDDVASMQLVDINTWLTGDILVKADRGSMAHGLELRTPFLDREVMSVASRLGAGGRPPPGTTKFVLREGGGRPAAAGERGAPQARVPRPDRPLVPRRAVRLRRSGASARRTPRNTGSTSARSSTCCAGSGLVTRTCGGARCGRSSSSRSGTRSSWSASSTRWPSAGRAACGGTTGTVYSLRGDDPPAPPITGGLRGPP